MQRNGCDLTWSQIFKAYIDDVKLLCGLKSSKVVLSDVKLTSFTKMNVGAAVRVLCSEDFACVVEAASSANKETVAFLRTCGKLWAALNEDRPMQSDSEGVTAARLAYKWFAEWKEEINSVE